MQIGSLVRPQGDFNTVVPEAGWAFRDDTGEQIGYGIVIDWDEGEPVVFWSEEFPAEIEYRHQLEVVTCFT